MNSKPVDELKTVRKLLNIEKNYDFEQYRQKILAASLKEKVNDGVTWYPVVLNRSYIGTGERMIVEITRTRQTGIPHAFQPGNIVRLFSNAEGEVLEARGTVNYIKGDTMTITLNSDDLPDWIYDGKLGVDLMFDEASYKEMERAINQVIRAEEGRIAELRDIILGYAPPAFAGSGDIVVEELNESQNLALNQALRAKDVAVIHGPPGTGKTTTLVYTIRETLKHEEQVLVCAPSNAAVDLLVEKLSDMGIETLRIGHPARVTEKNLSRTLDARIAAHADFKHIRTLRKRAEEFRRLAFQYKRNFGKAEREQRKALFAEAGRMLNEADILERYVVDDLLNKSKAIACTLVGAASPFLSGKTFRTLFMDEATQALEPTAWIPILKAGRVIFAGDHLQLPPTIKSPEAAKGGLAITLMEKTATRARAATMLERQYRMHADIMNFSNKHFYHGRLVADESAGDRLLAPGDRPVLFIDTAGCGYSEKINQETRSLYNQEEGILLVKALKQYLGTLGKERILNEDIQIGVISPYKAQVILLKELIEKDDELKDLQAQIAIDTVDAFQGREREIIFIGLARSNSKGEIGFLNDKRRMNVALTRAKMKLVVIGDSATLGSSGFYNDFLDYVQSIDAYMSAFEME